MRLRCFWTGLVVVTLATAGIHCTSPTSPPSPPHPGARIALVGGNLCSRMMYFGHFETELHVRFPEYELVIRNLCDPGDTPGFRPRPGRPSPWAFPGAERFQTELATPSGSEGHFESPDEWLTRLEADVVVAFFGYGESFGGTRGVDRFRDELSAFVEHTLQQNYNGVSPPQLALVSPIAFEDLSDRYDLPDGERENANLALYAAAVREVAARHRVEFIDAFHPTEDWYREADDPLTIDGFQLTDPGYKRLAPLLSDGLFGPSGGAQSSLVNHESSIAASSIINHESSIAASAVLEKNRLWHSDYKIPNGVHVFGRRFRPFGTDNYPAELRKIREMTAIRDSAIWAAAQGQSFDLAAADARTTTLPTVETNYEPATGAPPSYRYGDDAVASLHTAPGYRVELFASEQDFPDLANPVQLSFDNRGRLWVATMPSYPHWKPGDPAPDDKLLILEDTDGDGRADWQTTFADSLHLPIGFEFAPEGVYVSQGTNLILLADTDGDGQADRREIVLSGFDDHDTHHAISAFTTDESGAIYMAEGTFLHSNVETAYGTVRGTNGGFFRFSPQRRRLERTAQLSIPNPWGIAFDNWGQPFFIETSGTDVRWMLPGTIRPRYGVATHKSINLVEGEHAVRPTSGAEFVSSRHFPDEVQGDLLIGNTIGFLGIKQHEWLEDGTGYASRHRQDLLWSDDGNFRPVDFEFAPDGSLYVVDWHNVLIGHMQHNARDPLRDHAHGRIYRITYPERPLIEPAVVAGASLPVLLDNLKLPEYRTRYRSRRELRGRDADDVRRAAKRWVDDLDPADARYEHHLLEALWATWGSNYVSESLLHRLLKAGDHRVRAAAVRVLRYIGHQIENEVELLEAAARDPHGRVRMEAIAAASWLGQGAGLRVVSAAAEQPLDRWLLPAHATALAHLGGGAVESREPDTVDTQLAGIARDRYVAGREIYGRDGYCGTCHRSDGQGIPAAGFPPLAGSEWVTGDAERLIKVTLKGLMGPIEVNGRNYPGSVPMTPFEGLLDDEEMASVLTYVRNAFGNEASAISPDEVAAVRASVATKEGFYSPEELAAIDE